MSENEVRWWHGKDFLGGAATVFALAVTFNAEYELATAVHIHPLVAYAVPGALDVYVLRALQVRRDVFLTVLAMVSVNAASHLVTAGVLKVGWQLIVAVSAIAPLVLWRAHVLRHAPSTHRARWWRRSTPVLDVPPVPEHTVAVPPVPEHTPDTSCVWGHTECTGEAQCTVYASTVPPVPEHTAGVLGHWLTVPDKTTPLADVLQFNEHARQAQEVVSPGTVNVPEFTRADLRGTWSTPDTEPEHTEARVLHMTVDAEHGELLDGDHEHVEGARVLFGEAHPGTPSLRALKTGLHVSTDRARRLRAYLQQKEMSTP